MTVPELRFEHDRQLDLIFETQNLMFWIVALTRIEGRELYLDDFLFYPASSSHIIAGYEPVREVFRMLENAARDQGFTTCTVNAVRTKTEGQRRILSFRRSLV